MRKSLAEMLLDNQENGYGELTIYEGYSGRGMYGKETTGIVAEYQGDIIKAIVTALRNYPEQMECFDVREFDFSQDSMGTETIFY